MRKKDFQFNGESVPVSWNVIDRVVDYVSPVIGDRRYRSRVMSAISSRGGFDAADRRRPSNVYSETRELSPDSAIIPDLASLRSSSQDLWRNNCLGAGAIGLNVTRIVGNGLFPKASIDRSVLGISDEDAERIESAIEEEYRAATETVEIDAERQVQFSGIQSMVLLSTLVDGDCIVNMPRFKRVGSDRLLKLQLVSAARLSNPRFAPDDDRLVCGVLKDERGAPEKYYISKFHPGSIGALGRSMNDATQWQTLDAFDKNGRPLALHIFDKKQPGQTRGYPYLSPVIELVRQLGKFTYAEAHAAVVSSALTFFVESEFGDLPMTGVQSAPVESNEETAEQLKRVDLTIGAVFGLPPGKKVRVAESNRPSDRFEPFFLAVTGQIAMALEIPREVLLKAFTASYSASKAAMEDAWCYFSNRRAWLVRSLCKPVYDEVIYEAVAAGRLNLPGFFSSGRVRAAWLGAQWIGNEKVQIDESVAVRAAVARIDNNLSTIDEESRKLTGVSFEDKFPQILKERDLLRSAGLDPDFAAMQAVSNINR